MLPTSTLLRILDCRMTNGALKTVSRWMARQETASSSTWTRCMAQPLIDQNLLEPLLSTGLSEYASCQNISSGSIATLNAVSSCLMVLFADSDLCRYLRPEDYQVIFATDVEMRKKAEQKWKVIRTCFSSTSVFLLSSFSCCHEV